MEFERLFTALVMGGSLMAGGCGAKAPTASERPAGTDAEAQRATADCEEICTYPAADSSAREVFCPDTSMEGAENCCWLMQEVHPCCDYQPPLKSR